MPSSSFAGDAEMNSIFLFDRRIKHNPYRRHGGGGLVAVRLLVEDEVMEIVVLGLGRTFRVSLENNLIVTKIPGQHQAFTRSPSFRLKDGGIEKITQNTMNPATILIPDQRPKATLHVVPLDRAIRVDFNPSSLWFLPSHVDVHLRSFGYASLQRISGLIGQINKGINSSPRGLRSVEGNLKDGFVSPFPQKPQAYSPQLNSIRTLHRTAYKEQVGVEPIPNSPNEEIISYIGRHQTSPHVNSELTITKHMDLILNDITTPVAVNISTIPLATSTLRQQTLMIRLP
ncbi:putative ribonuclease H protein [Senna tora]|uniref:Putative ribonuclease H protein n=1 Tax=Senna tora TaxID=362788 RepID=A0A834TLE9_9FABA|nr:putative ribonuclease H protein [Senna tora]